MHLIFNLPEGRTLEDIKRVMALLPNDSELYVKVYPRTTNLDYRPDLPYQTCDGPNRKLVSVEDETLAQVLGLISPLDNFEFQSGHDTSDTEWALNSENRVAIDLYYKHKVGCINDAVTGFTPSSVIVDGQGEA